eukprot:TRINITY_DN3955_c0_g1_i1.p1 TRINITY_DN3955_c0_g1~~TRINITY_DN3955_c0_g1_i1.p1  ORF type:complete len:345 (+),score=20.57 TRINITY_DN3955_c0_g1_i1:31-1035(+)
MGKGSAEEMHEQQQENKDDSPDVVGEQTKFIRRHNFWILAHSLSGVDKFQQTFEPREGDIWLASVPKTGTTWTKALLHSILSLTSPSTDSSALLSHFNPHAIIPCVELFGESAEVDAASAYGSGRRLLQTHLPFHGLPLALQNSPSLKIVYVSRNPRDTFVSLWKFWNRLEQWQESKEFCGNREASMPSSKEQLFDEFCRGLFHGGPFAEHVLSYWNEHQKNPERVLWLSYEELQSDCMGCVLKMGRFMGLPSDLVEKNATSVVENCSFERLSNAEVNKIGVTKGIPPNAFHNSFFFRDGKRGGWKQHFSAQMEERVYNDIELKLETAGIHFHY